LTGVAANSNDAVLASTDWKSCPVGAPASWPAALRNVVDVMLAMASPAFIVWGAKETLLYNESFRATDVGLPGGLNGRQVADAAQASRPGLKVLFITGYAENAAFNHGHIGPGMELLTKPFAIDDLARRVERILGR
jgi:CheY-like chemotaxis protein